MYGVTAGIRYAGIVARIPLMLVLSLAGAGCNIVPSRVPLGEAFPAGTARSLDGHEVRFPDALGAGPTVLAIAYTDEADRDGDRWIAALSERGVAVPAFRIHATPGTVGILLSPVVDAGERKRAAASVRATTLTAYGDLADRIATQTGMGKAELARVMLVRPDTTIAWFCDTGFAPDRLEDLVANLSGPSR